MAAGIWKCRSCKTTFAGGAYEFSTSVAITAKVTMNRLKKLKEDLANPARQEEEQKDKKKKEKKKANKAWLSVYLNTFDNNMNNSIKVNVDFGGGLDLVFDGKK